MEKDLLISALERIEGKVDKVSREVSTNTAITESHTKSLSDMKNVHDINAKIIIETRDSLRELDDKVTRIESWKNGQTAYQMQTLGDIKNLHERLAPIEKDFQNRTDKKKEYTKNWSNILWKSVEKVVLIVAGAILISWRTIIDNIK